MSLTEQQIKELGREGYLAGIPISTSSEVLRYRDLFDRLEQKEGRDKCQVGLLDWHHQDRFVWELATHPRILDCIEALLGPDILLLASHFFCKYGPSEGFVAWHQDVTYWGFEPPYAISAWYAVDDSDPENGCMRVIPGTHRAGVLEHGKAEQTGNLLSINQELKVSEEDDRRAANVVLRAGEISLHHGQVIHGSLPNRSTRRRCGLAIPYVPASVKPVRKNSYGEDWSALLVRGKDEYHHFALKPNPF
ncbi:MAG: phytanoyl-CoA dioxygenase family protein [Armatimonadetes bacterium]|nr:phytanoyl-CoA dioxygenase family protein [Armatimonadota bacterium]